MSEQENPLSRWTRLKQAAKVQEEIEATSAGSEAMAVPEAPFDPASLPSIESIAGDQWDFNDPNAIPGFGPLIPTESGVDVLAQISSRLQPRADQGLTPVE